jgi:hypothetical protein
MPFSGQQHAVRTLPSADDARVRGSLWPTVWVAAFGFAAALAALAGWFIALGVVAFLGVFAGAYAVLSKAISMNYRAEGQTRSPTDVMENPPPHL